MKPVRLVSSCSWNITFFARIFIVCFYSSDEWEKKVKKKIIFAIFKKVYAKKNGNLVVVTG